MKYVKYEILYYIYDVCIIMCHQSNLMNNYNIYREAAKSFI